MEEVPASKPVEGTPSGKVWERPWSIAEMKEGSQNWTLASDAGVRPNPSRDYHMTCKAG